MVGFFLFVLKLHQPNKDGVYNTRINLRDISGGWVYLMCLPRLSCVGEVRFARSVKHGLIEPCIPIGKLDGTGQHIHRPLCSITAHQFFDKGIQFTGKKNYGAEGAEVIVDNCQVNLYGGFAPASQTAVELSKALGSRTVMSGSISRGKNDPSQSLQMIERPLMTPDELKSMPKGSFIVAKTGVHPMKVKLRLFLDWGIRFGEPYEVPEKAQRAVAYADKQELEESIIRRHYGTVAEEEPPQDVPAAVGGMNHGMQAEKNSRKTILRP